MLNQTLYDIWGYRRRRTFLQQHGLTIITAVILAGPVLILSSLAGSLLATLLTWLPGSIKPLGSMISLLVAVLLDISLFTLLYIVLPHGASTWRELLPGAFAAGLLWELAKLAFLLFVSAYLSASNLIYGSVAAIIAFLTWAHLSGLIFLFGSYLPRVYIQSTHPAE